MKATLNPPRAALAVAIMATLGVAGCGGNDANSSQAASATVNAQQACDSLRDKSIGGATVSAAVVVPATSTNPKYCKVSALIAPSLIMQVDLPDSWNGKLLYEGGGGYDGSIQDVIWSGPAVLSSGYAIAESNGGHIGTSAIDASFASDPYLAYLFGSGSVPTAAVAAQKMLEATYKRAPDRSYYEGCSNGGREGLMAAQRNPDLFDGVIARAPAYNWAAFMGEFNRNAKAISAPGAAFTHAKISLLAKTVRDSCDANDGIIDGVVSNPAACNFDPATLRCPGGTDAGDICLSDAQLAVVSSWTTQASFVNGAYTYPGYALTGNEDDPTGPFAQGGWSTWLTGTTGNGSDALQIAFQDATVKAYLAKDPNANSLTYDWNSNPAALALMDALNSATNADLRPFMNNGGKLLLWHGGNDPALSNRATTEYYERVGATVGGESILKNFVRYYQAPGVDHCLGGPGADTVNLVDVLDKWVTQGKDPGTPIASKLNTDGSTAFTRPLCPYPEYPRYSGPANDPNAAARAENYTCTSP
ncbi:Feruloyl esterase [Paraburkholderia sacchari]